MYRKSIQEGFRKIPAHKDSRLEFLPAKTWIFAHKLWQCFPPASAFYSPLTCKHRILQYWSLGPTLGLWCLTMPFSWSFIETVLPRSSSLNFMTADSDSHDNWHPGRICRRIESLELGASRYGAHVTERPADSDFIRSSRTAAKSRTGCNIGATEVRILSAVLAILVRFPIFFWLF